MKKKLVASLAAAMVLGVAGTSFAAANPFVDVPAKHWAYDSVMKLSQAGIVDGYGDGTYKGDKVITRYEMAQIVAKAMAKSDKADAKQKAELDKLSAEFAEELNVIGVRVSKLEKNASNVKFTADLRVRWNNTQGQANGEMFKDRFRMNMTSQINDTTTMYARYVYQDDKFNQQTKGRLSDMAFTTKGLISNTDVTLGRYTLNLGPTTWFSGTTGDLDGIMTNTKSGKFGLMAGYAQARNGKSTDQAATLVANNLFIKNIAFAEATYQDGKVKVNADYFRNLNAGGQDSYGNVVVDAYKISGGGIVYTFDKNVKVSGEYYKNAASAVKMADGSSPAATIARVSYKGANAANPGSWGAFFESNKFQGDSLPYGFEGPFNMNSYTSFGASKNGIKSLIAEVDYALAKNITLNTIYQFNVKDAVTGADAPYKSFSRVQVNYMF